MSDGVDYIQLIHIIESAPGFTLGKYDGILSKDDSYVNDFKPMVTRFCSEGKEISEVAAIEKIVNTADFDCVKNVIDDLEHDRISYLNYAECNEFAKKFVEEVEGKIKNKKWYHKIVIMQYAIIDAIHTIFKKCVKTVLICVDNGIILGLATKFNDWFKTLKISDNDIAQAVDSFGKRLRLGKDVEQEQKQKKMQQFEKFLESFEKNYWDTNYSWVDAYTKNLDGQHDVENIKKWLKNIATNNKVNNELITKLSKTLNRIFNVGDIYLIKAEVMSIVDVMKQKQKSKASDNAQQLQSVKPENESNIPESKISVTQESATEGCFESPVIEKVTVTSLEQHAEYIDQQFEKFLKSFEKNYWDTNCDWVDACTRGLGSDGDIKTLKTQLTNLIKVSMQNDWTTASSDMTIDPLSDTLGRIFGMNDSNNAVKSRVNAVIKKQQQQLLQNLLNILRESCRPFNATIWWNTLVGYMSFSTSLESPLWNFMQCVTGESDDVDITNKTKELSNALCKAFAVNDTASVTTRLDEIVEHAKKAQETTKKKYNADIVDNLLKVIDNVNADQGYVNLNPGSDIWVLINDELCSFIKAPEKRQGAFDVIHRILKGATIKLDPETIAESSATLLVNSGVINTGDKDKATEKIKGKIEELRKKREKESSTTAQKEPAPQPQTVETNTAQVQQEISSPAPDPQQLSLQTSKYAKPLQNEPPIPQKAKDVSEMSLDEFVTQYLEASESVRNHVNACTSGGCYLCNRLKRIKSHMEKADPLEAVILIENFTVERLKQAISKAISEDAKAKAKAGAEEEAAKAELDNWKEKINKKIETNFKKEGNKVTRFAKRAISKQERQKHTEQKTKNASELITAIRDIPSTIQEICSGSPKYTKIKLVLNSHRSGLANSLNQIDFSKSFTEKVPITEIEKIAKQIRKTEDSINSDSIMAIAVLYTILNNIRLGKDTLEASIKQKFTAFAKWFNKYVSPRSAIRRPEVVDALNKKIGEMAGDGTMFKCGKLTKAKDAIKRLAKKGSKSSGASVDTNSGSEGQKERKRDKFKKLISRKKKGETNAKT